MILLEKGMATHSSILAWRIPGTEEPGKLHTHTHTQHDSSFKNHQVLKKIPTI